MQINETPQPDPEEQTPEELHEAMLDAYYEDMSIEDHS